MTAVLLLHAAVAAVAPLLFARMGRSAFYLLAAVPFAGFAVSIEPGRTAPASPTRVVASGQVGT